MRFRTRVFLLCFLPFGLLLGGSFWAIEGLAQRTIREGLRSTMRENQRSIARMHARSEMAAGRYLRMAGEDSSLKACIQLLLAYPGSTAAVATLRDQLETLGAQMDFDFVMVSGASGEPLAAVVRAASGAMVAYNEPLSLSQRALTIIADQVYQLTTVPINQADENLGSLSVGEVYRVDEFSTPVVLLKGGSAIQTSIAGVSLRELTGALHSCSGKRECNLQLQGASYLSIALEDVVPGDGFELRSLQNMDAAGAQSRAALHSIFVLAGIGTAAVTLLFSVMTSRSIVRPVMAVVSHLRKSEQTGILTEFPHQASPVLEVQELTLSFNRAAASIREGRETLHRAYVEFVGSLASALDARDPYTAGHSQRVSNFACATAEALGRPAEEIEAIRLGSLLHDIGKIGISDLILQKPSHLTPEELAKIKEHPVIGRRILEGVHGFTPYLGAVEFHHENWDGSGYPRGQAGEQTPLAARIIHVVDAYDAMTSDRPYRRGMSNQQAIAIILQQAGTQFDPVIARAFASLYRSPQTVPEPRQGNGKPVPEGSQTLELV